MKRKRERFCETCKYYRTDGGPNHEPHPFCTLHAYRDEFSPCEDYTEQTSDKAATIGCIAVLAALLVLLAFTVPAAGNFIRSVWSWLTGLFS